MKEQWSGYITEDDLEFLAEGKRILVTWVGGNGPHEYKLKRDSHSRPYAASLDNDVRMDFYNPLVFVGQKETNTHVQILVDNCYFFRCHKHERYGTLDVCACPCHEELINES